MAAAPGLWSGKVTYLQAALNTAAVSQSTFTVHQAHVAYDDLFRDLDSSKTNSEQHPTNRLHRHGATVWPVPAPPCGLRDSQLPAASLSLTLSSSRHSADASDCPPCPTAPPLSPDFGVRSLLPQTLSTPTRAPLPMRATMKLVRWCATLYVRVGSQPPKSRSLPRSSPALIPAYLVPKPRETSSLCSQTSSKWGICPSLTRALHGTAGLLLPPQGAAATQRDTEKRAQYRRGECGSYRFTPLSMETFRRLGTPMMHLLSDIGNLAVSLGVGLFTKEQFVSGVLREISLSLCKTNARLEHGASSFFVNASVVCLRHGQSRPTVEVSNWK
jgi:hypothetical protein